ncbi:glycerophosphodiester phosphodiesterase family protein [Planococcus sp. ISL-109]|uniref:glycerophosphodiester phosphodiesterase n=1 Tax=Planococcus sp. ISL-109 TaxID=2819166 RepID=UPI001BEBA1B5|nr:glycerophosphodiester phosphodiesterase family protein [Planococcus sp. ISL-109]MBT2582270.1 hypothetical protein [Planococcus sp. ISL-109]
MCRVEIYAHRGASGVALENTWKAFNMAHQLGVGIELDIQLTQDGIAIVYHDEQLKRLTGTKANISDVPFQVLEPVKVRKLFKRFGSHQIPLASDVFDWAFAKKIPLNIELKSSIALHPSGPEIITNLLDGMENFHLSSFDIGLLEKMKSLRPDIEVAWIMKKAKQLNELEDYGWVDSIHFHKKFHRAKWLEPIAALDKPIRLYGVIGNERFLRSLHPSVKGLITDYPSRIA